MKLLILGYYNTINSAYLNFKSSLEKFKIQNYEMFQATPFNLPTKIAEKIQSTKCEIILVLDINDSLICNTDEEIISKFMEFDKPVVFGAQSLKEDIELHRWWYYKEQQQIEENIKLKLEHRENLFIPTNKYANTHHYIGYANFILDFLYLPSINYFIELNADNCALDLDSKLFGCITVKSDDLLFFRLNNDKIQDKRSLEYPCILLIPNSRTDLYIRLNRYSNMILDEKTHTNYQINWISILPFIYMNRFAFKYFFVLFLIGMYFVRYFMTLYV